MDSPPWFRDLVDGLSHAIGAFDNKDLAFAIALAILLGAVLVWAVLHVWRHRPWLGPVVRLTKALRKLQGANMPPDQRIAEATTLFRDEPRIEPLWREYRTHLLPNPGANGYLNLVDPRIWFSVDALPGRGYEQWSATWSGIFLTVGLLFTFIGLSAALLRVGGINWSDSMAIRDAIKDILGISSAKFITSIAGLIAYIGFSLITRRYQTRQHIAARELADAVQHLSIPLSPELLLHEQNKIARSQLLRMERLTDDLAVAIDDKLRHRLTDLASSLGADLGKIQTALPAATAGPIVDAVAKVSESIAQSNTQGMEGVLTRVAELADRLGAIKEGMGGAGDKFGNEIKEAAAAIKEAAGAITGAAKELSGGLAAGGKDGADALRAGGIASGQVIEQAVGRAGGAFDQAVTMATAGLKTAITDLADRLKAVEASLGALPGAVAAQVGHLGAAGETFKVAGQTVTTASLALQRAAQPLEQTATGIQAGLDLTRQLVGQAVDIQRQTSQTLQGALDGLKAAAEAAEQTFKTHEERFGEADEALAKALDALRRGVDEVATASQKAFAEYDIHITKAVSSLKVWGEGFEDAVQELGASVKQLAETRQPPRRPI